MKIQRPAFTLLEVVIALALSCVVVLGMLQAYRNLMGYFDKVKNILASNRQVCLLFNQMERDFNAAFIPPLYKEIKKDAVPGEEPQEAPKAPSEEDKKKEEAADRERLKNYFIAACNEDGKKRLEERYVYPFKRVSMITTNPLQIYGQRRVRIVRVAYELEADKPLLKQGIESYRLVRKETTDIENVGLKVSDGDAPTDHEKQHPIRTHLVAKDIKSLYVEYAYKKPAQKNEDTKKRDATEEEMVTCAWGEVKETQGVVPLRIDVFVEFWNSDYRQGLPFQASFLIFSYPTPPQMLEKKEKKVTAESPDEKAAHEGGSQGSGDEKSANTPDTSATKPNDSSTGQSMLPMS